MGDPVTTTLLTGAASPAGVATGALAAPLYEQKRMRDLAEGEAKERKVGAANLAASEKRAGEQAAFKIMRRRGVITEGAKKRSDVFASQIAATGVSPGGKQLLGL